MGRAAATFGGVMILALIAGGLTEATLAWGHRGRLANDTLERPVITPKSRVPVAATPTPTPKVASATPATPTPAPAPTATPSGPQGVTNSFVHMRAGKTTSTPILADLEAGTRVEILSDSDAQWQQVRYNGNVGYLYKLYLDY